MKRCWTRKKGRGGGEGRKRRLEWRADRRQRRRKGEMKKKRGSRRGDQVRVYISKAGSNTKCR